MRVKSFVLVTGGARSGKSTFAEKLTREKGKNIVYIATSIPFDEGMKDRIKKHRESRPKEWATIEKYKAFNEILENKDFKICDTVILDCMTLMVSNLILEKNINFDKCSYDQINKIEDDVFKEVKELLEVMNDKELIIVTNEVGMGIVPANKLSSIFRDIAGRVNQYLAQKADEVYFSVSGLQMRMK